MSTSSFSRRHFLTASSALVAGALAAPGLIRAQTAVTVRLAFAEVGVGNKQFAAPGVAPLGHARGFVDAEFKDDPSVKIEWSFHKGAGPSVNEALANNQADFAFHGDLPSLVGRSNGLNTKILLGSDVRSNIYIAARPDSGITTPADLKGRNVGLFRGTNLHLAAAKILAAYDLTERDVKIINLDFASANAAIVSGDIDATFGQADLYDLEAKGIANVIFSSKEDSRFTRHAIIHAQEAFIGEDPEITQRIVNGFVKAAHWGSDEARREDVIDTYALTGRPREGFVNDHDGQELRFRLSPLLDPFLVEGFAGQEKRARELELIRNERPTADWFEPRFLEAALKEQGLAGFWQPYGLDGQPLTA
ncbi:ABC transporter substrate-binding protein [Gemmobacter sp. 24YEA27]|uniref:ABC transporter substrate-binding protein n=1 Tax=Gemmobacter sp. 24YEA27 TaxID=3040672 RepID=UPI0024B36C32|nr:ABC transporter substrate-binding protein [Gemmobacter sp. 24YEA27]